MRTILLTILLAGISFGGDVTGKWSGSAEGKTPGGETRDSPAVIILKMENGKLSGSIGPSSDDQIPLENTKLEGDKLTFQAVSGESNVKFTMTVDGDSLRGEAVVSRDGENMTMKLELKREK